MTAFVLFLALLIGVLVGGIVQLLDAQTADREAARDAAARDALAAHTLAAQRRIHALAQDHSTEGPNNS
jgi:hypothetical protein